MRFLVFYQTWTSALLAEFLQWFSQQLVLPREVELLKQGREWKLQIGQRIHNSRNVSGLSVESVAPCYQFRDTSEAMNFIGKGRHRSNRELRIL